ncbi:MAG: acyltransferase [Capsulimonadales bacterium]|nr:acyltransferase [Capsulimonadales bacterium]
MSNRPERFYSLDVLRGVAALSIVVWHWKHFFTDGARLSPAFHTERQPLFALLHPLYTHGDFAVDLFFSLSGFIFYWLYSARVADRSISVREFLVLRFSRLYPLHFVTLIAVAIGQAVFLRMSPTPFVYADNDLYHFALNLLFLNGSGLQKGYSFNGPNWSISVEVLMYALFFLACRFLPVRWPVVLAMPFVGYFALSKINYGISRGILSFFLGGCVYFLYDALLRSSWRERITVALPTVWAALCLLTGGWLYRSWGAGTFLASPRLTYLFITVVLFPLTILMLALSETRRGSLGKRFAVIGDLSYGSYLLHFPLQLLAMILTTALAIDRSIYYSPLSLLAFYVVLIVLSFLTFRHFEKPMQRYFRTRWLPAKPGSRSERRS